MHINSLIPNSSVLLLFYLLSEVITVMHNMTPSLSLVMCEKIIILGIQYWEDTYEAMATAMGVDPTVKFFYHRRIT